MIDGQNSFRRWLRSAGYFVLSTLTAVLLPGWVDTPLFRLAMIFFHERFQGLEPLQRLVFLLHKQMILEGSIALALGFFFQWYWLRRRAKWNLAVAKWVWVIPTILLAGSIVLHWSAIMAERKGVPLVRLWEHFSGQDVFLGGVLDYEDVMIFTTTFIKGVAYSLGAVFAGVLVKRNLDAALAASGR